MTAVTVTFDPNLSNYPALQLDYTFSFTTKPSDMANDYLDHVKKVTPDGVAYSLRPEKNTAPPALWINGKWLMFKGIIRSTAPRSTPDPLPPWTAGFIQTIHGSQRNAHYEGGVIRRQRLDTSAGPLKDGNTGKLFYPGTLRRMPRSLTVDASDAPNFQMPLRYGINVLPLASSSGFDRFSTHLVLVQGKTIVRLACLEWKVSYDGKYDWSKKEWTPSTPNGFLWTRWSYNLLVLENLDTNPVHTPFSMLMDEGETYCEIQGKDGWQPCTMQGEPTDELVRHSTTWRTSPDPP